MADFFATNGADNFAGTANADNFVVNHAADIQAGDAFTGGSGTDTLWVTRDMTDPGDNDVDMPGNLDFSSMVLSSLEILSFNYMKMPMPGQAIFSSSQFGAGLSNTLEVRGAWGDQDITVNLVSGDSSFDASGWTFPSNGTLNGTSGGLPMGTAIYVWGGYVYGGEGATGMFAGQSVGGTDTIHINGSAGANTITGTIKDDMIDGGDGNDTVVFAGNWADYTISLNAGVFTLTSAATGTDKVSNTESFQFANGTYTAANLLSGNIDVTAPDAPVIEAWTDTTDPILINGTNPLWRISGQAEPGAIIKLYTVTLAADGTVTARTQISTYTQGTPNPTTGAPTIVVGPDFVVADANGNWEFQSNLTEHGDRRVQATATDASDNVSDYSLVAIQGGHHTTTMSFTDPTAFANISKIDGYHQDTGPDILKFTTATTVTDADFAKIHDIESVQLTGASTITLGANALAAGIGGEITPALGNGGIITGDGNTSITDTNARALNVNASAMLAGTTLTLAGAASFNVTGSADGTSVAGGAGNDTVAGNGGADSIDGGDGTDTAVYAGNWADYTISKTGNTFTIAGGTDGGDEVTNVENFQFANGTYTAAQLISGDQTPPSTPTIEAWTDTTDPILINGANPLWRISGQAEPGAIIKLYTVTLAADGTVTARTQISTYTQGTPNPTTGAPTIVVGPDFVVADANGNWEFQSNLTEHGDRRVQATATDASDNVSDYSLVAIQGGHHTTTMSFTDPTAFANISKIDGYHQDTGPDILKFTTATTVTDADFAKIHDIESVQLTGASTITLGANALAAGIGGEITPELGNGGIITGDGNTSITDTNARALNVNASAMLAGTTLTLAGAASFNVTGSADGTSVAGGAGNDTVAGNGGADSIDGGDGTDTAVYAGNWADYTISKTGNTFTIAGGTDGGDEVTNVENFQFANGTYNTSQLLAGDNTAPDAPVIEAWTDTTDPILINGTNPLWRISGQAEPGAIIKLYTVTLAADGTVTARTQISTYTQGTPNPTTGAPTIVVGPDFVVADVNGNWEFQSNLTEHGDRRVQATATDASDNVSDYSLVAIQGGHHTTTMSFTDPTAFANISKIDGYHQDTGPDILKFTTATTVTDADFAKIHDIESVQLTGASTITLGANALAAGIGGEITPALGNGGIITGDGNTSITDTNARALNVNASAMLAGTTLTLAGAASFNVTGSADGTSVAGGAGNDTVAGNGGADSIDGGDGTDTAVYAGNWADYTISKTGNTFTIAGGTDGGDEVTNVENFQFANGTYTAAQLISGDQTPPSTPTIEAWTDTTDPILINGANPLWRISGQAEPGAIIKLYTVTLAADGTVTARTQISTYTQGTPNPTTGAPTIVVGPDFVVADANGNWEFQSNLTEHGDRRVQATATDASDNVSDYSLVAIQGGHHTTTMSFTDPTAFANISKIDGYHQDTGPDILKFTTATTVTDADFAKIHDIESVQLTGASTITLGANALAAGIGGEITPELGNGGIITGDGNTSITDTNARALNVNASAMLAGTTLTLAGAASFNVTGSADGTSVAGGAGNDTVAGNGGADSIDGGDGTDTAVYAGNWADYTISKTGNTFTIAGGTDGGDEVTNVENFQFANVTVAAADLLNVAPTDISLTGSNVADNAAANTVVGSLSVTDANAALGDTASYVLTDNAGGRFAISGGNIVVASNAVLAFGSYDVTVQAEDAGGLTHSEMFTITVDDATAPSITITAGPAAGINTNVTDAMFSWAGNDGAGSGVDHYEYSTDGGGTWTSTTDTSVTLSGLVDGANSFRVRAIDVANNTGLAASREWNVDTSVPYMGTAAIDIFEGAGGDEDFIFNKQAYVNAGDDVDGGGGIDTLWAAEGMMDYEENFDFSAVVFRNMEALAFNYMPMPMPGQVIFSSTQFGAGLLSDDLMIYGAWDDQKITVNLADGNSSFDASGWQFANAGSTSGTQSAVWGKYTYTGGGMFSGQEVGGTDTILLAGSAGDNRITGTSVADVIYGGAGSDTMAGGRGNDTYYADRSTDLVTEAANGGTDVVYASATHTMRSNVENLVLLGTSNFAGTGNGSSNAITGNSGANTLYGAAGNDVLKGGAGTDTLLGSTGNDKLTGGLGMDKLTGGSGLDRFIYTATAESSGSAVDRIYDLRAGDKIDVHLIDANSRVGGNQTFVLDAFGDRSFDIGHIRQTKSGANLILDFNTDADSAAEMRIILMNHGVVKASDFIL